MNCGIPVVVESPQSELTKAIRQLAQAVFGNMEESSPEQPEAGTQPRPLWSRSNFFPRMAGMVF